MKKVCAQIRQFLTATTLTACILFPSGAAADLKSGVAAYRAGDYETALREFTRLSDEGNAHAEFNLAILYLTGRGVEKDIARSIELHRSAAGKGLPAAMHGLGVFHYQGNGVKQDYAKALEWFRKSAALGFADSEFNIGVMYFNRQGVKRDDIEVVKWVTLAAARKFPPAEFRLGQMYENGVIFTKNPQEALHWYRLAAEHGNRKASAAINRVERSLRDKSPTTEKTETPGIADKTTADPPSSPERPEQDPDKQEFSVRLPAQDVGTRPAPIPQPPADRDPAPAPSAKPEMQPVADAPKSAVPRPPETSKIPLAPSDATPKREWRVQLAAFRTVAEVDRAWTRISDNAADAIGETPKIVARADLGERGIYHRLQVGPVRNKAEADALCARIRAAIDGQSCLPVRARVR